MDAINQIFSEMHKISQQIEELKKIVEKIPVDKLVKVPAASKITGVSARCIRKMARNGDIRSIVINPDKKNLQYLVNVSDILQLNP